jgi:hypothetical protein
MLLAENSEQKTTYYLQLNPAHSAFVIDVSPTRNGNDKTQSMMAMA